MKKPKRDPWKMVLAAVRDMERTLALSWPTNYGKDPEAQTCRIDSDPVTRRHMITLPSGALDNFSAWRPSAAHELCHAWLAENVDPIFSAWRFPRRCNEFTHQQLTKFKSQLEEMYLATSFLLDVWVDDLRHVHWPELSHQEMRDITQDLMETIRAKRVRTLCEGTHVMAIALHVVSSERHCGQAANMDEIYVALPTETVQVLHEVVGFLRSVPPLPYERVSALRMLEQYAQQSAALLQASFVPQIVEDGGIMVWEIMN